MQEKPSETSSGHDGVVEELRLPATLATLLSVLAALGILALSAFVALSATFEYQKSSAFMSSPAAIRQPDWELPGRHIEYRDLLEGDALVLYDEMEAATRQLLPAISVNPSKFDVETVSNIYMSVRYDNPDEFWLGAAYAFVPSPNGSMFAFMPQYLFSYDEAAPKHADYISKAKDIVTQMPEDLEALGKDASSSEDQLAYIYDLVVSLLDYSSNPWDQTAVAFFDNVGTGEKGQTVCAGYSRSFQFLCDAAGLDCYTVGGTMHRDTDNATRHEWNMAKGEDGTIYFIDCTWGSPAYPAIEHGATGACFTKRGRLFESSHYPEWACASLPVLEDAAAQDEQQAAAEEEWRELHGDLVANLIDSIRKDAPWQLFNISSLGMAALPGDSDDEDEGDLFSLMKRWASENQAREPRGAGGDNILKSNDPSE